MLEPEYTIQQLADSKKVSHWTIRKRIAEGTLKCQRYGPNTVRIKQSQVDDFDRRHTSK